MSKPAQFKLLDDDSVERAVTPVVCPNCGRESSCDENSRILKFYTERRVYAVLGAFRGQAIEGEDSETVDVDDNDRRCGFVCNACDHEWGHSNRIGTTDYGAVKRELSVEAAVAELLRTHDEDTVHVDELRVDDVTVSGSNLYRVTEINVPSSPDRVELRSGSLFGPFTPATRSYPRGDLLKVLRPKGPPPGVAEDLVGYLTGLVGPNSMVSLSRFAEAGIRAELARLFTADSVDLFFAGFLAHRELRWHLLKPVGAPAGERAIDL